MKTFTHPLTKEEHSRRFKEAEFHLNLSLAGDTIQRGIAMKEIKDGRLYRAEFPTFEDYIKSTPFTIEQAELMMRIGQDFKTLSML